MKISLEALEHWGFVVAMAVFSFMAYTDYSRDGDRISLAHAVAMAMAMAMLAILATYFRSFHKWEEKEHGGES